MGGRLKYFIREFTWPDVHEQREYNALLCGLNENRFISLFGRSFVFTLRTIEDIHLA